MDVAMHGSNGLRCEQNFIVVRGLNALKGV